MDRYEFFSHLFLVACLSGFGWQSSIFIQDYFAYDTLTDLVIEITELLSTPDLTVCFRYPEMLDRESYLRDKKIDLPKLPLSEEDLYFIESVVTVEDVFRYTPPLDNLFLECMYRTEGTFTKFVRSKTECEDVFSVSKFLMQSFVCYTFSQKASKEERFNFKRITSGTSYAGMFWYIVLRRELFEYSAAVKSILHSQNIPPFKSAALSPIIDRMIDEVTFKSSINYFELTYSMMLTTALPAPYTTMCRDYTQDGFKSANDCMAQCLTNKTIARLGKVPFSTIQSIPIDMQVISTRDIRNVTVSKIYVEVETACVQKCYHSDCYYDITMTKGTFDPLDSLRIEVGCPRESLYAITFTPKTHMVELVLNLSSCFGIWFGASVLGFSPFEFLREKLERRETSQSARDTGDLYGEPSNKVKPFCLASRAILRADVANHSRTLAQLLFNRKPNHVLRGGRLGFY